MRYPKLRELREAIKAIFTGPYTTSFPYQPHKPYERFRGKPEFHEENCIGCSACAQVCPTGAIEFKDEVVNNKAKRVFTIHWDVCIFCGQCQANCPSLKGIILSNEFDLATTEKREDLKQTIEKKLVLCECCNEVIAPFDQILWVAKRIGILLFTNASLFLFYLSSLNLSDKEKSCLGEDKELFRADRTKIICPRCRREIVFKS